MDEHAGGAKAPRAFRPGRLLAPAAVAVLLAGACGGGSGEETGEGSPPPAPTVTPAAEPGPPPAEASEEPSVVEVAPAPEPAAPAPEPEPEPAPPAAELFDDGAEGDPPPDPEPAGGLDDAAVADLVAGVLGAQSGVVSASEQGYLTLRVRFEGEPDVDVDDVPYAFSTTVDDRTYLRIDQGALANLGAAEDGSDPAVPADAPPLETILDEGAEQIFIRLGPLAAASPEGDMEDLAAELTAQGFDMADLPDLWGRVDSAGDAYPLMQAFGVDAASLLEEFLELLEVASSSGSILEARALGSSEAVGVPTEEYRFEIDLVSLADQLPPFFESFFGGFGGTEDAEILGELPVPLAIDYALHVDADGLARRAVVDLDLGAILMAAFAGLEELFGEDGEAGGLPEIEYRVIVRTDVVSVNDPSLSVTLPDPSLVVELPAVTGL